MASSTDPSTWATFAEARRSLVGIGLGFVLNGDGIVCLDVDHCLDERGRLTEGAAALLDLAGTTYVEVSPSGKGLHVWGRAELTQGRRVSFRGQSVELYPSGRYMTVTGKQYLGSLSVLGDVSAAVAAALDEP
ncbi:MAG: hypothetical protein M3143_00290 [Actinomycetota bacterium]|nr:hypothetical protein [Actinomycetota bacterium]